MTTQSQLPISIPQHFDFWSGPKYPFSTLESRAFRNNAAQPANMTGGDASELIGSVLVSYSNLTVWCFVKPSLNHLSQHTPSDEDIIDAMSHISEHVTKLVWRVVTTDPNSRRHCWRKHTPEPPEFRGLLALSSTVGFSSTLGLQNADNRARTDRSTNHECGWDEEVSGRFC